MGKKIMVIDDESDVITYLTTLLEENGYQTDSAKDGVEGLKKIKENKPDLICLDILMPEKSGIGLYRELKKDAELKGIPVVIVTGFRGDEHPLMDFKEFLNKRSVPGPEGYMEKPIDKQKFLEMIRDKIK
ncbi:MAG: response regulator [Deltaproteobacteria bacterium]|jgi:CheY-like chemotaxis protein|nr:MAG: response regulator [Deltaproteobacteria bacterium]